MLRVHRCDEAKKWCTDAGAAALELARDGNPCWVEAIGGIL